MRDIKFRGKTFKGDWVYGNLYEFGGLSYNESLWVREHKTENTSQYRKCAYDNEEYCRINWREGIAECNAPVLTKTVGQFTRRKDKNEAEIYSGDIYDIGICTKVIRPDHFIEDTYELMKLIEDGATIEVIGNATDNPNLLESEVKP